ncbi:hemolysin III family protein [Bradyrhizobium sp. LHD-71]|uniref:PAQR family membrane homeostasis protein TrhA n=1 Tax=Bradyrhizobium sp. LHD-71 TaxID=3072141 RepID=UPI00280D849E|nr:hemolysin III family protein [Bradyrhizobium sp. LHD-71]MDQ8732708.1 hemolysin III family protein [Bradyrhizobium sp. LHD-71]
MTPFQLKEFASRTLHGAPPGVRWNYDRHELLADGIVHAIGVGLGLVAAIVLIVLACHFATVADIVAVSIYAAGLITMLALSATYNLFPVSRWKWILRRFDHSAIYALIAATYTPFIAQMEMSVTSVALMMGVWTIAAVGIVLKLFFPGRFDRLAIGLYLAMGWSGVMVYEVIADALPKLTLWLIAIGGVLYSAGVIFHVWERLKYQNAIWHGFVLVAASFHYAAVLDLILV